MAIRLPPILTVEDVQYRLEELSATLPRPIPDTPDARAVRDEIARCMFLALNPVDVLDANFACQIILLSAHANDSLRIARETAHDPTFSRSARAQARSMMRLVRGTTQSPARSRIGSRNPTSPKRRINTPVSTQSAPP